MQCVTCKSENVSGAKFCSACGSPLDVSAPNSYTPSLPLSTRLQNGAFAVGPLLGRGGFGITYKGGEMSLKRWVAIKEFFPQGAIRRNTTVGLDSTLSPTAYHAIKAEFIKEAQTLAQFGHPGIVRVFSVFEENNTAYIVMEFLEGQSLQGRIEAHTRLSEENAVEVVAKVGAALSVVHSASLIHRDIKPDNIMLTKDDRVVLIDFGTARAFAADKTVNHTAMLTPGYAPLEQYGHHARFGPFSDIYALGATLYHALTGQAPPPAPDIASGVELKPPHTLNASISQNVSNAVMWAMKTKASERPQTMKTFLDALKPQSPVTLIPVPVTPIPESFHPFCEPSATPMPAPVTPPPITPIPRVSGEVRVSLSGRGDYTSLSAAVKAVLPGTRIVVESGDYYEPTASPQEILLFLA